MTKILQATSQGQVTIPKVWRDKYQTRYFISEINDDTLIIKPLMQDSFADTVESSWREYKKGMYVTDKKLMKQYGL